MKITENFVFSIYPLSPNFQKNIERFLGISHVKFLRLSELHDGSLLNLYKNLRKLKTETLWLPIEYRNFKLFIPLLKLLSIPMKIKNIKIITPEGLITSVSKWSITVDLLQVFSQTLVTTYSFIQSRLELSVLLNKPIINYPFRSDKKVLYIDGTIWMGPKTGGCVGHICGVANALLQHDYGVYYAAEGRLTQLDPRIPSIDFKMPKLFIFPPELNRFHLSRQIANQLYKYCKSNKFQFIYQRMSVENYSGVKLSQLLKVPLVLEFNSPLLWITDHWADQLHKLKFKNMALQIEKTCLKFAQLIVTISEAAKSILLQLGISEDKILCYPNCIDPTLFDPARFSQEDVSSLRQKLNLPESAFVITFIGTFGQWHGVEIIAKAIQLLVDQHPIFVTKYQPYFLLIGNGAKMPIVQDLLSEPRYKKHVILTGLINQDLAPSYLAASDAFLSPHLHNPDGTRFFGSPTKLFEYMAMAKPIIASNLEQIGQVLENSLHAQDLGSHNLSAHNGKLAILHEPGNVEQIVRAIIFLAENPQYGIKLGENARNEALNKYTWFHHTEAILQKIEHLKNFKEEHEYSDSIWNKT